jgi:hypothetical protein
MEDPEDTHPGGIYPVRRIADLHGSELPHTQTKSV